MHPRRRPSDQKRRHAPLAGPSASRVASGPEGRVERDLAAHRALISLAEAATAGLGPQPVLKAVVEAAAALAGEATVHLWRVDEEAGVIRLVAETGGRPGVQGLPFGHTLRIGQGLAGTIAQSREPLVVTSLDGERRLAMPDWARDQGFVSFAGVPVARVDRLLGVLCLFTWRRRRFSRREVDLLRSFAAHAAVAVESAALFDAATSRLRRLDALREIGREISEQRDPDALLALIGQRASELLEGDSATVWLVDEAEGRLRTHAPVKVGGSRRQMTLALGEGVVGVTGRERKGMVVNNYPASPHAIEPFMGQLCAVATQPLLQGTTLQGVIAVARETPDRPFTQADSVALGDVAVQASIALENARLLGIASSRAERVKAAAEVGRLLVSTLDADRILDLIAEKCREILGASGFGLFRLGPDGNLRYARGFGLHPGFMREHTLAVGEGVVGRAVRDRRPVQTADLLSDPDIWLSPEGRARIEREGNRALVGVPVLMRDEVIGALAVYHPLGYRIPADEAEFLETLAHHAGAALENARLFAQTRRRQETAETLAAITQTVTSALDLKTLLSQVAEAVRRLLHSDGGAIGLTDPDGSLHVTSRVGLGADAPPGASMLAGEGVTGWVVARGEPFWTSDYVNDPRITHPLSDRVREAGIASVLGVPVRLPPETVGVIYAFYARPVEITEEDVLLASDLARIVAIAVQNARLYESARQREAQARALFEVGRLISATLDPERVLDLIVEKARALMAVPACGVFRLAARDVLSYARGAGLSPAFVTALTVRVGEGTSGGAVAARAPVWSADILADPAVHLSPATRALVEQEGYRAVLSVPIEFQDSLFGCLSTYWWERHTPTPGEIETLSSLATLAAVALESAGLYDEARAYAARLEDLSRINRAMSASLRLDEVLAEIARAAGTLLGAPVATLWVADDERRVLTRRAGHGDPAVLAGCPQSMSYDEGGVGWVARHREPLLDVPVESDPRILAREWALSWDIRSFSGVPVLLGDRLLGVLTIGRERETTLVATDLAILQTLLGQAAIAIENARLYEDARRHEAEALTAAEASRRAFQDLQTAQEHLVQTEKLRALGEMASGVAHDFNNILAAILGRVQLMLAQVQDPLIRKWLGVVERAALDGAQTVRQIQEFTRIRRDQPTETVDLNQVVRDAVEMTQTRWRDETQSRGLDVRVVVDHGSVPPVDGHPAGLRDALTNLLLNAVDALPHGGTITIATRQVGGSVHVSVSDDGIGMSDDVRRRIFQPFFSTKGPRGTGLGLAMVYGIVSRHAGEVQVESKEGAGSTFTMRLPIGRDRAAPSPAPLTAVVTGTARVLVVDDEDEVRENLGDILRLQGHEVVMARHGAEALERFQAAPFDVVMTDLAMPGMSGWQVARAVKALRADVPVVLVTGWGVELTAEELQANGVDRVMTKPFRLDDVLEVVASLHTRVLTPPSDRPRDPDPSALA